MECGSKINTKISPMPRFWFVAVDIFPFLVRVMEAIFVSVFCKPQKIGLIFLVCEKFLLGRGCKEIDRESRLVFAVAGFGTKSVTTTSFFYFYLIIVASVPTYYRNFYLKLFVKIICEILQRCFCFFSDERLFGAYEIFSSNRDEIRGRIFRI